MVALHRFLASRAFYALWFASALVCALLAVRIERTGSWHLRWLVWNLFLAWVPYGASLLAEWLRLRQPERPWRLLVPSAIWLAFLPNAPYLVTEMMHITQRADQWLYWYDVITIVALSWTGCVLGAVSLGIMQGIVARYLGRAVGWLFVLASAGLCGFGIYVGRFQRWNSWDLLVNPLSLLRDLATVFHHPMQQPRPWALCALFAAFVLVSYLTLAAARAALPAGAEQPLD
jgi:uncharacterized membrane protein